MRLKYISLCLLGLSLGGCTQHVIKSTTAHSLDQRAVHAVNAVFEYPSYDYNGTFKFDLGTDQIVKDQKKKAQEQQFNDPELEKKVRAVLKAQRINLTNSQLEQLYQVIASKEVLEKSPSGFEKTLTFILGLLDEMQFSYDGSMHYKQKMASMNLTAKYEKSNLLVQATVPMVVDLNNYKFYTNYFALMPLMVNKDSQSILAYVDFSKYKSDIERIDLKGLMTYLKESSTLPYMLADVKDLQTVSLNEQDKAQGAVEKIRLNVSLEEWMLQARLYEQVNKPYLKDKMSALFVNPQQSDDANAATLEQELEVASPLEGANLSKNIVVDEEGGEAYRASEQLDELIQQKFMLKDEYEAEALAESEEFSAGTSVEETPENLDDDNEIGEAECLSFIGQAKRPLMGDITYCNVEYGVDIFAKDGNTPTPQSDLTAMTKAMFSQEKTSLDQKFESYASKDFKDAQAFKVLWNQQKADITQALAQQGKNPVVINIALDDKGRAVRMEYDVAVKAASLGTFKFKTDMNLFNYGRAKPINRAELNRAKSIEEVSKDSIMENMLKGVSKSFGVDSLGSDKKAAQGSLKPLSLQLHELAMKVYGETESYAQTYQALFILKISAEQPEIVKRYSTAELIEIASLYAYHFAKPILDISPEDQDNLSRLAEKHNLHQTKQFNNAIGGEVYRSVISVIEEHEQGQQWQKIVQKHKTAKAVFAEYYLAEFLVDFNEDEVDPVLEKDLRHVAQILGQAYEDTRKNKLTDKTIGQLKEEDLVYIDYDLYQMTFEKVMKSFK